MGDGWIIRCHPGAAWAFALERDEPDQRAELDGFVKSCREGMILFDVGAHFGLFGLAALRWSNGTAQVFAVDPSPSAGALFDTNMRLAGAEARVTHFRVALSDSDGELLLLPCGPGGCHMMVRPESPRPDAIHVPVLTLDALVARMRVVPTHLKIDVEGEEDSVLRGGEQVLRRDRPLLFLELHGSILRRSGRSALAILERVQDYGYHQFEIAGQPVDPAEAATRDVARIVCR